MKRSAAISLLALAFAGAVVYARAAVAPIELPTGWRIAPPPPQTATLGTLPTGIVLSRDGSRAFVLETGHAQPALRVIDTATLKTLRTVNLPNAYGAPVRDVNGDGVWIADTTTFEDAIAHVDTDTGTVDATVALPTPFSASALAFSPDGTTLAVAADDAARVALVDVATRAVRDTYQTGRHPAALAFAPDGKTLYVADRAESSLDAIGLEPGGRHLRIGVGLHPAALAVDERNLYVGNSDDDDVAVVSLATNAVTARAPLPFATRNVGRSPDALTLDGDRLYVACGAGNAIAVYRRTATGLVPIGAMPAGWYPTAVAIDAAHGRAYVLDGKGEGGHPNPDLRITSYAHDIADNLTGSVRALPLPSDAALRDGLREVLALGPPSDADARITSPVIRPRGPIRHVIYVIKENRTYDQVLGDVPGADGDASLTIFGASVTPNQHALVKRFGIFDRFFADAQISADGHNWSTAAFANDYVERTWPANAAGRRSTYDFEAGAEAATPHGGYLWDAAARAHVTFRNYGEFVVNGPPPNDTPVAAFDPVLEANTDVSYPGFDMNVTDAARIAEWKREFAAYEANGSLPQLEIVRLPRDHTAGTQRGKNTPAAMVEDNDAAVGTLIDTVSHARDWPSTAVFIVEDDAQNGPDHVDEQRSTLYVASPYARPGVHHAHVTTSGVLRTIEIVLGLPPMSAYDAGARTLADAFAPAPDTRGFTAQPVPDPAATNGPAAYRERDSERLDFAHADEADPATLNAILAGAMRQRSRSLAKRPPASALLSTTRRTRTTTSTV
jgi:DNA-binding beta-propeller fold protein YncE